ncbi:MAG: hypothetical protein PHT62_01020 [Desulfotomaculaceae bacterium]|nr:hypothetical protein [Desulfotomaculaceae bacterium]
MIFPRMVKVRQNLPSLPLADPAAEVRKVLLEAGLGSKIRPGAHVGITAGSRGIRNIALILRQVVDLVKSLGGRPLILSAMGSHGGGAPEGQLALLKSLGISEDELESPLDCSLDSLAVGRAFYGDVFIKKSAQQCDAIVVINRIKPHTSFHGDHESGLLKMLAVGLGGPAGAASLHSCTPGLLSRAVAEGGLVVLKTAPVILGLAVLEDAYEQTRKVVALQPEDFLHGEKSLLEEARRFLPGLPTADLDVLVVDQIGKNISGTGMDTNVIGRLRIQGSTEPQTPCFKRIVVLDVAQEAHGNAYGIGLADFTTGRLVGMLDRQVVNINALTSTFVQRAMLPMALPNDREAISAAIKSLGGRDGDELKLARIYNTLHLSEMLVSEKVLQEIASLPYINVLGPPEEITFTTEGNLLPFRSLF